ncbi:MAG: cryptochrome/photolyase family protein, partial [Bacteroidota bacterium]
MYHRLALILGNCLFPDHSRLQPDAQTLFFMAEDHGLCTHFRYHKQKLVLFLSAMRSHAEALGHSHALHYHRLEDAPAATTYEDKLAKVVRQHGIREVVTYDIEDHFFATRIAAACKALGVRLTLVPSPGFLCSHEEFTRYNSSVKKPFMHTFYQRQRKRLQVLLDETGKPLHGKWSFDVDNRKKLPRDIWVPPVATFPMTGHSRAVSALVEAQFPDHPGHTNEFQWATTRADALAAMEQFFTERFHHFGPYEDAIDRDQVFVFHSTLSPYLNLGLLTPEEVVNRALEVARERDIHYPSLEGFIRQIIGWREFLRGIYHTYERELQVNHFGHQRHMRACWYDGTTGIPPLDDSIRKALRYGYTHHIERLMILGNVMLLCELHPDAVYRWFMELYVDSSDWVMAPNVYGMSQFSGGGIFATKPYLGGSNYLLKMSNYQKAGDWPEV